MIIELAVMGLAAAVGGFLAARAVRRRQPAAPPPPPPEEKAPPPDPFAGLPARVGDVIQHGDASRWPESAILVHADAQLICAVLLSREQGRGQATVAMAPPDACLYWLDEHDMSLPPTPPTRIEVDGVLLDRRKMVPVTLERIGTEAPDLGETGRFALYEGSTGGCAILIQGSSTMIWCGKRLEPDDYDRLGQGIEAGTVG